MSLSGVLLFYYKYEDFSKPHSALAKQISIGLLFINLDTFLTDRSHEENSSEMSLVHIFNSVMYWSLEHCFVHDVKC